MTKQKSGNGTGNSFQCNRERKTHESKHMKVFLISVTLFFWAE